MIYCINYLLEFIINFAIVLGICLLLYFYVKLIILDKKIEDKYVEFEKDKKEMRETLASNGGTDEGFDNQVIELQRKLDEFTEPLKRKRERIISKIPFLRYLF